LSATLRKVPTEASFSSHWATDSPPAPIEDTASSFAGNPLNPASPEIESAPTMYNTSTTGSAPRRPPSCEVRLRPVAYTTAPAPMSNSPLYSTCAVAWAVAPLTAAAVPTPIAATMNPTWLTMW
jgi:hypothetical protein